MFYNLEILYFANEKQEYYLIKKDTFDLFIIGRFENKYYVFISIVLLYARTKIKKIYVNVLSLKAFQAFEIKNSYLHNKGLLQCYTTR